MRELDVKKQIEEYDNKSGEGSFIVTNPEGNEEQFSDSQQEIDRLDYNAEAVASGRGKAESTEYSDGVWEDELNRGQGTLRNMWNSFNNSIDEIDKGRYEGEADEIRHQMDLLEEQLYSGERIDEGLEEEIMAKMDALSAKMDEAKANIAEQEEDIESSPVDADYAYRQQELLNEEYTGLSNYIQYEIPKELGGTASEWGTQAALLAKNYMVSGKLKKMLLKNALKSVAAETLSPVAHGIIAGGLTAVDVVTDLMALYKMRENETNAESSEALRERMGVILEENGLTQEDYANLDEPTQRQIRMEAWKGMDEFKARQMSLGTGDVLDKILLVSPWAKWGKGLSGYNKLTRIGSAIGSQALGSVTEGGEEGAQYSFARDYVAGKYKDDPINFGTFVDSQYELFKAGKYTLGGEHRFEDELDFRNAVRSGALLGGMMTGTGNAMSIKNTVTDYNAVKKDIDSNKGALLNQEWSTNKANKISEYVTQDKGQEFKEALRNMKDHTSPETYSKEEVEAVEKEFNEAESDYKELRKKTNNSFGIGTPVGKESAKIVFPEYHNTKTRAKALDKDIAINEAKTSSVLAENNITENDASTLEIKKQAISLKIAELESATEIPADQQKLLKILKQEYKAVDKKQKEVLKFNEEAGIETDDTVPTDFISMLKLYADKYHLKAASKLAKKDLAKFNDPKYIVSRARESLALMDKVKEKAKKEKTKKVKEGVENAESKEEIEEIVNKEKEEVENNTELTEEEKEEAKKNLEETAKKAEKKKKEDPESSLNKEEELEKLNKELAAKGLPPVSSIEEAEKVGEVVPEVKETVEEGKKEKQKKRKKTKKKKQQESHTGTVTESKGKQGKLDFDGDVNQEESKEVTEIKKEINETNKELDEINKELTEIEKAKSDAKVKAAVKKEADKLSKKEKAKVKAAKKEEGQSELSDEDYLTNKAFDFISGLKAIPEAILSIVKKIARALGKIAMVVTIISSSYGTLTPGQSSIQEYTPEVSTVMEEAAFTPANKAFYSKLSTEAQDIYKEMQGKDSAYIIAEKATSKIHFIDKTNDLIKTTNALYGTATGDNNNEFFARDASGKMQHNWKGATTPAGEYKLSEKVPAKSIKTYEGNVFRLHNPDGTEVKAGAAGVLAFHQTSTYEYAKRVAALKSKTASDNKLSGGCINITKADFEKYITPNFSDGTSFFITSDAKQIAQAEDAKDESQEQAPNEAGLSGLAGLLALIRRKKNKGESITKEDIDKLKARKKELELKIKDLNGKLLNQLGEEYKKASENKPKPKAKKKVDNKEAKKADVEGKLNNTKLVPKQKPEYQIKPIAEHSTEGATFVEEFVDGKPKNMVPKPNDLNYDKNAWEATDNLYIANKELKVGDEVFYEYNTDNVNNTKANFNRGIMSIEVAKYEGDRRIVVGIIEYGKKSEEIVAAFKERITTYPESTKVTKFDDLKTTVKKIDASRVKAYDTNEISEVKDVLREGQPLILGVIRSDGTESYAEVPESVKAKNNIVNFKMKGTARTGKTHLIIQRPDGSWFPNPLYTKQLKAMPELITEVETILNKAIADGISGTPTELIDKMPKALYDILPFTDHAKDVSGKSYQLSISKDGRLQLQIFENDLGQTPIIANTVEEFMPTLEGMLVQVDSSRLADKKYVDSIVNRLNTNLNPKVHFTGTSIQLNPIESKEIKTKEGTKAKEPKVRRGMTRKSVKRFKGNYEKWNSKQQMAWFKEAYKGVDITMLDDLKEVSKYGENSWGLFLNGAVYIARNAAKGTAYHEGFHVVMNMFLNDKQNEAIIKEADALYGHLRGTDKAKNEIVDIMDDFKITEQQAYKVWLEEQLAEDFRMYMQDREGVSELLPKKIANFFRKMYILVKDMLGMGLTKDEVFLYSASKGFNNPIFTRSIKSVEKTHKRVAGFTAVELNSTVRGVNNFVINDLLPKMYPGLGVDEVFANHPNAAQKLYEEYILGEEFDLQFYTEDDPRRASINRELNNIGDYTIERDEQGEPTKIVDFKGKELYKKFVQGLRVYGININVRNNKAEVVDGKSVISEEEQPVENDNYSNGFSLTEASISSWERAGVRLKAFLSSIPKVSPSTGQVLFKGGMIDYHNGMELFNKLIEELNGTYSPKAFKNKLADLSEHEPSVGFIYDSLYNNAEKFEVEGSEISINVKDREKMLTELYARVGSVSRKIPMAIKEITEQKWNDRDKAIVFNRSMIMFNLAKNGAEHKFLKEWEGNSNSAAYKYDGEIQYDLIDELIEDVNNIKGRIAEASQNNEHIDNIADEIETFTAIISDLGIAISKESIAKLYNSNGLTKLLDNKGVIPSLLKSMAKGKDIFHEDNGTYITNIAKIFKKALPELSQLSYIAESKTKYVITNPNFLAKFVSNIKDSHTRDEAIEFYGEDVYFQNSPLMQELSSDPNKANKLDYVMFESLIDNNGNETDYTSLTKSQFMAMEINSFIGHGGKNDNTAYYTTTIPADAPQIPLVKYVKETQAEVLDKMYGVYQQESARIATVKDELSRLKKEDKIENMHDGRGTKFHFLPFMNKINIESNLEEEEVKEIVRAESKKFLDKEVDKYLLNLEVEGMIAKVTRNDKPVLDADENIMYKVPSNSNMFRTGMNTRKTVTDFVYNDYYMQSQITTITGVDPAYYSSDVNFYKRAKQTYSPGAYLNTDVTGATFESVFLKDEEAKSEFKDAYYDNLLEAGFSKDIAVKISSAYGYSNATESIKTEKGKYILIENASEEQLESKARYNVDSKGNGHKIQLVNATDGQSFISLDRYELIMDAQGKLTDNLKQTISNIRDGKATPGEIRQVLMPFKPFFFGHVKTRYTLTDGTSMTKIIPMQIKNSESVLLPSFAKGNPKLEAIIDMFDKGISSVQFESAVKVGGSGIATAEDIASGEYKIHTLKNSDYRIQQETPEHHIDTTSLFGTQIRKLIMADLAGDNYLYGGVYTANALVKEFSRLTSLNIKESYEKIKGKFDKENIMETLEDAIIDRQLGDQYIEALAKLPLYDPIHVKRIEAMMSSIVRNNVTNQKFNGGSLVNTSSYGLSNKLKTVFNKGGGIEYMEAIMPAWSKKLVDENGYIKLSKIDPALLEGILYRIPNEDKYSMFNIKVVEFLPEHDGGKIFLPDDVTTIAGLDFDIDKLYAMMYELTTNADGTMVKADTTDNSILDLMMLVLKDPNTLEAKLNPGNFDKFREWRDTFFSVEDKGEALLSSTTKYDVYKRNMASKDMIGILANHNTNHALVQHYDLSIHLPISIDDQSLYSLSGIKNVEGERTSKEVASILAAVLDNAGDPISGDVNLNVFTADMFALLLRVGHSLDNALAFINQPIVRAITEDYFRGNATLDSYNKAIANHSTMFDMTPATDKSETVLNNLEGSLYDDVYSLSQGEILKAFLDMKPISEDLGKLVRALRVEKGSGTSLAYNAEYIELVEEVKSPGFGIKGAYQMFEDDAIVSWTNSMYQYGIVEANTLIGKYIPYLKPKFVSYRKGISYKNRTGITERIGGLDPLTNKSLRAKDIEVFNEHLLDYMHSGLKSLKIDSSKKADFLNEVEEELIEYKKNNPDSDYNSFVSMIISEELSNPKDVERMLTVADKKGKTKWDIDDIRYMWEGMAEDGTAEEQDLANKLVRYAYYTTGFSFSPVGLSSLIPVSLKAKYKMDDNADFESEVSLNHANRFAHQFIRNNYKKLNYLPTMIKEDSGEWFIDKDTIKKDKDNELRRDPHHHFLVVIEKGEKSLFKMVTKGEDYGEYRRTESLGTNFINEYDASKDNIVSLFNEASELVKTEKLTAEEEKETVSPSIEELESFWGTSVTTDSGNLSTYGRLIEDNYESDTVELLHEKMEESNMSLDVLIKALKKCK